jgi:hypothetical protein
MTIEINRTIVNISKAPLSRATAATGRCAAFRRSVEMEFLCYSSKVTQVTRLHEQIAPQKAPFSLPFY